MRVFNAMVVRTLLYGRETWTILKRHESKLQAFDMMCLRRVEGVTRKDRVRNEEVKKTLGQEAVMDIVKEKQRKLKDTVEAMSEDKSVSIFGEVFVRATKTVTVTVRMLRLR